MSSVIVSPTAATATIVVAVVVVVVVVVIVAKTSPFLERAGSNFCLSSRMDQWIDTVSYRVTSIVTSRKRKEKIM